MSIKIVTDSSNTMEKDLATSLGITIIPLSVMVDGEVYADTDLKEGQFLEMMRQSKHLPKTSQPPVGVFADTFARLAEDGSQIIAIHMTHSLSGTIEAARQGAALSGADVTVVDSSFTDQATKFQVVEAARLAQKGASKEEILAHIEEVRKHTELYIGVSTLENLVKGGRIGRVTGLLSSLLNIRVIMQMRDHILHPIVKGRGHKTFTKWLDSFVEQLGDKKIQDLGISYAGERTFADQMAQKLQPYVKHPISVLETSSIVQTHTGEDAWAILVRYES